MAGTWLSCVGPTDHAGSADRGITADQFAARKMGQDTPLPSLEIAGEGGHYRFAPGAICRLMWEDFDRVVGKQVATAAYALT